MFSLFRKLNCITETELSSIKSPKTFKDKEKKIIKIATFIFKNFQELGNGHSFNFREVYFEQTNIFKLINVYGFGNCIHASILFAFLMDLLKIKNKMVFLKYSKNKFSHVANILYIDNKIYFVDVYNDIFQDNKKLIPYNDIKKILIKKDMKSIIKKMLSRLNLYTYKNFILFRCLNLKDSYLKSFRNCETFNLYKKFFKYKKYMQKLYSKHYFYQKTLFFVDKSNKILDKKNSFGFLEGKLVNDKKFLFQNKIILFPKINDREFSINNFPFPITDIKINTIKKSKLILYFHNNILKIDDKFSYSSYFLKKKIDPVYSFKIESDSIIKSIKLQFLISDFRLKLGTFLKNL
tara:strand:- start:622 stop:1671 length:1050 start_codon:yes stop_codon:yes gene_type:complete